MPPVIDSRDVLQQPRGVLTRLCETVGVAFDERMLEWPPGFRDTDGVWARHWYAKASERDRTKAVERWRGWWATRRG